MMTFYPFYLFFNGTGSAASNYSSKVVRNGLVLEVKIRTLRVAADLLNLLDVTGGQPPSRRPSPDDNPEPGHAGSFSTFLPNGTA